jgi:hypothetical protein
MIVWNKRSWFGSYAVLHTSEFDCMVSTALGLFKATIIVTSLGPDGKVKGWPLAKAYLRKGLFSKVRRDAIHDYVVGILDQLGRDKINLYYAIEGAFSVAKARGLLVDYIIAPRRRFSSALKASGQELAKKGH